MTTRVTRLLRHLRQSDRGGAMIELAVVLPVLILIAIGVMDYGRVYFTSIAVANAARAGAEWGAQNGTTSVSQTAIQNFAKLDGAEAGLDSVKSNTTYKCGATVVSNSTACANYGVPRVYVEVTAYKTVALLIHYPGIPPTILVRRTATFREQ